MKKIILLFVIVACCAYGAYAQASLTQPGYYNIPTSTQNGNIRWCLIPQEFSLPGKFKIVEMTNTNYNTQFTTNYCGGAAYSIIEPTKYGFSHMATRQGPSSSLYQALPKSKRAQFVGTFRNTSTTLPWQDDEIPFGNDIGDLVSGWEQTLYVDENAEYDLIMWDTEKKLRFADIQSHMQTFKASGNNEVQSIPNGDLHDAYVREMTHMYNLTLKYSKNVMPQAKASSYSDAPFRRLFFELNDITWSQALSGVNVDNFPIHFDYLMKESASAQYSNFYHNQDFFLPSVYYFFHPSQSGTGRDYLAYMLFNLEVNIFYADPDGNGPIPAKEVIPVHWMRYHNSNGTYGLQPIDPYMAESSPIFSILAGADGVWLWDANSFFGQDIDHTAYDYFNRGLYRLSRFNSILASNYTVLNESNSNIENPEILFDQNRPVWRGIVSEDESEILVAAHNPYANGTSTTTMNLQYNTSGGCTWTQQITLTGREIYLQSFPVNCNNPGPGPGLDTSDMELWLSGGDASNFTNSGGTFTWHDISGNNRDATQSNSAKFPSITSSNTLFFTHTSSSNDDQLRINNPTTFNPSDDWQVFFVCQPDETSWQQVLNFGGGAQWGIYAVHGGGNPRPFLYTHENHTGTNSSRSFYGSTLSSPSANKVYSLKKQGSEYYWYINGVQTGYQNKGSNDVTLSTGSFWEVSGHYAGSLKGELSEIIVYRGARTTQEQSTIDTYLLNKYVISSARSSAREKGVLEEETQANLGNKELLVYPNPLKDKLLIYGRDTFKGDSEIQIYDISGKQVFYRKVSELPEEIDVKGLNSGIYTFMLKSKDRVITKKIIK